MGQKQKRFFETQKESKETKEPKVFRLRRDHAIPSHRRLVFHQLSF
jgi:hypothetical protein